MTATAPGFYGAQGRPIPQLPLRYPDLAERLAAQGVAQLRDGGLGAARARGARGLSRGRRLHGVRAAHDAAISSWAHERTRAEAGVHRGRPRGPPRAGRDGFAACVRRQRVHWRPSHWASRDGNLEQSRRARSRQMPGPHRPSPGPGRCGPTEEEESGWLRPIASRTRRRSRSRTRQKITMKNGKPATKGTCPDLRRQRLPHRRLTRGTPGVRPGPSRSGDVGPRLTSRDPMRAPAPAGARARPDATPDPARASGGRRWTVRYNRVTVGSVARGARPLVTSPDGAPAPRHRRSPIHAPAPPGPGARARPRRHACAHRGRDRRTAASRPAPPVRTPMAAGGDGRSCAALLGSWRATRDAWLAGGGARAGRAGHLRARARSTPRTGALIDPPNMRDAFRGFPLGPRWASASGCPGRSRRTRTSRSSARPRSAPAAAAATSSTSRSRRASAAASSPTAGCSRAPTASPASWGTYGRHGRAALRLRRARPSRAARLGHGHGRARPATRSRRASRRRTCARLAAEVAPQPLSAADVASGRGLGDRGRRRHNRPRAPCVRGRGGLHRGRLRSRPRGPGRRHRDRLGRAAGRPGPRGGRDDRVPDPGRRVRIVPAALGDDVGLIGTVPLVASALPGAPRARGIAASHATDAGVGTA